MVRVQDIYNFIDKIAPFKTQMEFDNSGFLVGNFNDSVTKVLVCLDITKDVIDESKKINSNLIISHHPVIFHPIKNLYSDSIPYLLSQNNINAICAHTNLDIAKKGVNYCLFECLKLQKVRPLSFYNDCTLGLIGNTENEISPSEFSLFIKKQLNCKFVQFTSISKKVSTVAICSGSCGNLILEVYKKNCDSIVTGEIKHSDIMFANDHGISIFNVGHFKSENVIVPNLKKNLQKKFPMIEFVESERCSDKIEII